jgi:Tol biopolymer transport system component
VSALRQGSIQANDESSEPDISADGRFVAYYSHATNLVRVDTNNHPDIFVHDRVFDTTRRVNVGSHDGLQANGLTYRPSISGDGKTVNFISNATSLTDETATNTPPEQIYSNHNPVAHIPYYDPIDLLNL